jgi:GldM N-terminal domain
MKRFIAIVIVVFAFFSCSHKSESDLAVYKTIQAGFSQSANAIASSNKDIYLSIEGRAQNPGTASHAEKWLPKALLIKDISDDMAKYIESLVRELKVEAGIKMENEREIFREDDKDAVERVFITNAKGKELQKKLIKYKNDMLAIDTELLNTFEHVIINVSDSVFKKGFTKTYFQDIPAIAALALLKKYGNEIVSTENEFLRFCLNKTVYFRCGFGEKVQAIVSQNSDYIKAGGNIEITAGVGSFYTAASPQITIQDKVFRSNTFDGIVKYKFKTPLKSGKYYVPVKIEYVAEDGRKQMVMQQIKYTVVE